VKDGIVKLADFGISRHYIRNAEMTACGTPLNVAPEVFKTNKYTSKIDIWSFGVVCYEMLKGKHPFNASNFEDLQEMHQNDLDYSSLTQDEVNFLKLALNPLPAHRSDVEGLIKSKLISEYLSKIFTDISELYLRISTENSKLSQKVRLSLCLYILTEVLFTKDKSQFKLELNDLKNSLNISTLSSKTQENLLKSLLKYSEQLNEKSPSSSSLLVYIHRRLSALPNIENFN
jgi:serine/threonine protein kinase